MNVGYEICFDGIREMFLQNPPLLSMLKTTTPKILAEATTDRLWGTGIQLRDTCALISGLVQEGYPECLLLLEKNKTKYLFSMSNSHNQYIYIHTMHSQYKTFPSITSTNITKLMT